jgi:hypothetical protein
MDGLPQIKFVLKKRLNVKSQLVAHRVMLHILNHFPLISGVEQISYNTGQNKKRIT